MFFVNPKEVFRLLSLVYIIKRTIVSWRRRVPIIFTLWNEDLHNSKFLSVRSVPSGGWSTAAASRRHLPPHPPEHTQPTTNPRCNAHSYNARSTDFVYDFSRILLNTFYHHINVMVIHIIYYGYKYDKLINTNSILA